MTGINVIATAFVRGIIRTKFWFLSVL